MIYGHLRADCLYTGITSGPSARYRLWESLYLFTFNCKTIRRATFQTLSLFRSRSLTIARMFSDPSHRWSRNAAQRNKQSKVRRTKLFNGPITPSEELSDSDTRGSARSVNRPLETKHEVSARGEILLHHPSQTADQI